MGATEGGAGPQRAPSRPLLARRALRAHLHEVEPEAALHAQVALRDVRIRAARAPSRSGCPGRAARACSPRRSTGRSCRRPSARTRPRCPACRSSYSERNIRAPVGQTLMQLPQKTQADLSSGMSYSVEIAGVEPAAGDGDRERVLGVHAARLDALVAEDAARVVPDEERRCPPSPAGRRSRPRTRPARGGGRRRAASRSPAAAGGAGGPNRDGIRAVPRHVPGDGPVRQRRAREVHVHGRAQQLQDELPRVADPLVVGLARSCPGETFAEQDGVRARPPVSTTHTRQTPSGVSGLAVAQRGDVDALGAAGLEDRGALRDRDGRAVDRQLDGRRLGGGRGRGQDRRAGRRAR